MFRRSMDRNSFKVTTIGSQLRNYIDYCSPFPKMGALSLTACTLKITDFPKKLLSLEISSAACGIDALEIFDGKAFRLNLRRIAIHAVTIKLAYPLLRGVLIKNSVPSIYKSRCEELHILYLFLLLFL